MNISGKLRLSFIIVTLLTAVVGIVSVIGMNNLRISGLNMYQQQVVGIEHAGKALSVLESLRLNCRTVVIHSFYDDRREALNTQQKFESNVEEFRELMMICAELSTTDELRHFNEIIIDMFENSYLPMALQIIEKSINDIPDHNNRLHINVMLTHINEISDWIVDFMTGMMDLNVAMAENTSIENEALTVAYIIIQTALLVAAIIFAVLVALYIIKSIMKPINESANALGKISTGDFEARMEGSYGEEFSKIKDAVNSLAVDLKARELMISGITYASIIQRSLLPPESSFSQAFSDHSVTWEPKDIVSGDIYGIRSFDEGTVLCVCDCTGHGTHGALLTMLVISTFRSSVNESNYKDTAAVVWEIDKGLVSALGADRNSDIRDGCDLAVVFIANDGSVSISSANINVLICNGIEVTRVRGQKIWIGGGTIGSKDDILVIDIPADPRNKYYIASDGLYEQIGGDYKVPFGYKTIENVILENHDKPQSVISSMIWQAFELYKGENQQRDDLELITFKPKIKGVIDDNV